MRLLRRGMPRETGEKALAMEPVKEHEERQQYFDYGKSLPIKAEVVEKFHENTVKGSQFKQPMLEFHGACAGCGETPYAILITRLFGERMYIANATGCSSIWPNSSPTTAYTTNTLGQGPAWSNSLFEDGAEFGYGMALAHNSIRSHMKEAAKSLLESLENTSSACIHSDTLHGSLEQWLDTFADGRRNGDASRALADALQDYMPHAGQESSHLCRRLLHAKDFLSKNRNGFSAATDGHMILALAAWIMCLPAEKILISSFSIRKYTPIREARLPRQLL